MDNELFELCHEVFVITAWSVEVKLERTIPMYGTEFAPAYTSDYLLEKLPGELDDNSLVLETDGKIWWSHYLDDNYVGGGKLYREAQSPLKALLKLTIALHEAGEL